MDCQVCGLFSARNLTFINDVQIPSKDPSMRILLQRMPRSSRKREHFSQNTTGRISASDLMVASLALLLPIYFIGPKRDENGVENFEAAFKDLSRYRGSVKKPLANLTWSSQAHLQSWM